jgi:hypothetical protein
MNESVYRSPKWLRNIIDFEVNTGGDIKGEPSKKAILKEWDQKWEEADEYTFKCFYAEVIEGKRQGWPIPSTELSDIKKKHRGDMSLWDKFDKWLPLHKQREKERELRQREREKREREEREKDIQRQREEEKRKEQKQKEIEKELDDLSDLMVSDFSRYPYSDKISTPNVNGEVAFHYTFEDGRKVKIEGNKIHWGNVIYTVGNFTRIRFVKLANEMIRKSRTRPNTGGSKQSNSGQSQRAQQRKSHTGHPKEPLYNTLKQTIKQREEQLKKMSKTDPDRSSLENELENAKKKLQDMRIKYQFEHLVLFESFGERSISFVGKRNPNLKIDIIVRGGRILSIDNESGIRFPFSEGQTLSRNIEVWACNNNFYMDGKDTCPEKKIFGIRTSDVPKGHEWRHIYPGKFK